MEWVEGLLTHSFFFCQSNVAPQNDKLQNIIFIWKKYVPTIINNKIIIYKIHTGSRMFLIFLILTLLLTKLEIKIIFPFCCS